MAKVDIEIPNEILELAARDRIAQLEKDLKNALERERKLKVKVKTYKEREDGENRVRRELNEFVEKIADDLGLHDQCGW